MTGLSPLPEDWDRAMAVFAHPDDIEYGLAAAVARWTGAGKTVTYLLASRGEAGIDSIPPAEAAPLREQEERNGAREVGVDVVDFLEHTDGVIVDTLGLRRDIARAVRRLRPEVLLTGTYDIRMPGGMTNQADHRAVGLATLDAARDAGNRWIFPELIEEGLEPWGGVRFVGVVGSFRPSHAVEVDEAQVAAAIESLRAHAQYTSGLGRGGFDPAPFLTWQAVEGGRAAGVPYAVLIDTHWIVPPGPPPWV